jgi:hypothetical protein
MLLQRNVRALSAAISGPIFTPMNTHSRRLTSLLAALAVSMFASSVALAGGHGHGGGSFAGAHQGGHAAPREGGGRGNFSSGGSFRSSGSVRSSGGSFRSSGNVRSNGGNFRSSGSFRSGGSVMSGGNFSSGRNIGGTMRSAPSGRPSSNFNGGFNRPTPGLRIPDASRPGYSPGSHPRPGFTTTRPDLGVSRNNDRPTFSRGGDRPSFTTRPDFNRGADRRGNADTFHRPGFTRPGFNSRPSFDRRPGFDHRAGFHNGRGFAYRPGFGPHRHWHGGYWNGAFWPRTFYRSSFVTFWPVLPVGCQTFYFGGVPYYYYDSIYYTWSPARYGYVVTDPPPSAVPAEEDAGSAVVEQADDDSGGSASIYVYPRNGQSEEQTAQDRYECHQWAVSQTGYDPTTSTPETQSSPTADDDYRRALVACLDARGYSAK